jgi:phosphatidylserine/phosphatidylglycerophosphate/cardiolipin synthase-like enzyme
MFDMQDIGMFKPSDLDALRKAFEQLSVQYSLSEDDEHARSMARALIQLYRHGVRDPQNLIDALGSQAA